MNLRKMNLRTMTASALAAASMLSLASSAWASPLDPAHVPAEAKWVIHVDLQAIANSDLADRVRQNRPELAKRARQWIQNRFGVDPREDLDALTMFSDTYESHTGTMILKAGYDQEKIKAELEKNPNIQSESAGDLTFYTLTPEGSGGGERGDQRERRPDEVKQQPDGNQQQAGNRRRSMGHPMHGGPMTIVLVDDKTVVFASSAERAKQAVQLVKGESPSLKGQQSELLREDYKDAIVYGAAIQLKEIEQHEGIFPVLRQHERIYLLVRGEDGKLSRQLILMANTEEVAENMQAALEGLIGFGKVWAADSQNLSQLVQDAKITRDGKTVQLQGSHEMATVLGGLGELRDRIQQRIGLGNAQ